MDPQTTHTPYRNGPTLVRGPIDLVNPEGNKIETKRRTVAICRCGESSIRPLCDGTHKAIGFTAPGRDGRELARRACEAPSEE